MRVELPVSSPQLPQTFTQRSDSSSFEATSTLRGTTASLVLRLVVARNCSSCAGSLRSASSL